MPKGGIYDALQISLKKSKYLQNFEIKILSKAHG